MQYIISPPDNLNTTVRLPASKSISNRVLILNALSMNAHPVVNLSDCEDTQVMIDAFNSDSNVFDVKAAGTSMRFLTAFLSGVEGEWVLKGTPRMHERPIYPLVDTLRSIDADIEYLEKDGYPPIKIRGKKLTGGEVIVPGSISSQYISALMMIAPTMSDGLIIDIENEIISQPYIELTKKLMEAYGAKVKWEKNRIEIKPQKYKPISFTVESDWSAASYWYAMAAMSHDAEVTLLGLSRNSKQGDSNLVNLFSDLGVSTEFTDDGVVIRNTGKVTKKFFHNFINEPDLAQTFTAVCCFLNIPFIFSGVQSLKIKETDRIAALITEMKKFGFVLKETDSRMLEWDGELCFKEDNPVVDTYEDHRMAMSLSLAAMRYGSVVINDPHVVGKSYPEFWNDLKSAGFKIEEKLKFKL